MEPVVSTWERQTSWQGGQKKVTLLGHIHLPHLLPITSPAQTIREAVLEALQRQQSSAPAVAHEAKSCSLRAIKSHRDRRLDKT